MAIIFFRKLTMSESSSSDSSNSSSHAKVLVVGAGMAGLSAAHSLLEDHRIDDILVLEARFIIKKRSDKEKYNSKIHVRLY